MSTLDGLLRRDEQVLFDLRALYQRSGYTRYRMSRFEEYDLYAAYKDFLSSGSVITFTDTDGRLLALKPDITLSLVRSVKDGGDTPQKRWYQETVYRAAAGSGGFRELTQLGLECIGPLDAYTLFETLLLAAESLRLISADSVLCVSHLGLLSRSVAALGIGEEAQREALRLIAQKNGHELRQLLSVSGAQAQAAEALCALAALSGSADEVLPRLRQLALSSETDELCELAEAFRQRGLAQMLRLDFSVVNSLGYYSGLVFHGYVRGVPQRVLSGGQYDLLMRKLGRSAGAIGFAIYADLLELLDQPGGSYDVDTLLVYHPQAALSAISAQVQRLSAEDVSVLALPAKPQGLRCRRLVTMDADGRCAE